VDQVAAEAARVSNVLLLMLFAPSCQSTSQYPWSVADAFILNSALIAEELAETHRVLRSGQPSCSQSVSVVGWLTQTLLQPTPRMLRAYVN